MIGFSVAVTTFALLQTTVSGTSLRRLEYQAVMSPPAPNCFVENGYDYIGNDISNALGPVESCCVKCSYITGCAAWSWTNLNGGTCWYKSAQGQIQVNPNVKSALFLRGDVKYCQPEDNTDYVGNDIANKPSNGADNCCPICQNTPGCRAYSWTNLNGGTCWLKSAVGSKIYKTGAKAAVAYPTGYGGSPSCPVPIPGVDYVGDDIANKPSSSPEGCCDLCKQLDKCRAYSWTNQNGGTCWLKSAKGVVVSNGAVTSAQVYDNVSPSCSGTEYDVDYVGNDIGNTQAGDWTQCCSLCASKGGCGAWSWSNYNGGTCWLKSGKGQTASKGGVKSAVLY